MIDYVVKLTKDATKISPEDHGALRKVGFDDRAIVLATRRPLVPGKQVLSLVADRAPKFAGVDPYNERITRNSNTVIAAVDGR